MNKKMKIIMVTAGVLIAIIVVMIIIPAVRIARTEKKIRAVEIARKHLSKEIREEEKAIAEIKALDPERVIGRYFNRKTESVEEYIRELFKKEGITFRLYLSGESDKEYSEVTVECKCTATEYFAVLKECETGERMIVVENTRVNREKAPLVTARFVLRGYYESAL